MGEPRIAMDVMAAVGGPGALAVFDSGLGGLTVVRALQRRLPTENLVYFGDTARVPYGAKSPRTVLQFARQCLRFLMRARPKLLVVACNTVSATALERLRGEFSVPLIGVLEPGAAAAVRAVRRRQSEGPCPVGLIATEATIASGAYPAAVRRLDPAIHLVGQACPLLVPLIEEGRPADHPIVRAVLADYLTPLRPLQLPVLILGCTHYPLLAEAIMRDLGPATALVDSADETALVVAERLATMPTPQPGPAVDGSAPAALPGVPKRGVSPLPPPPAPGPAAFKDTRSGLPRALCGGRLTCYVTDQGQRFETIASRFLGQPIGQPIWVDPDWLEPAAG